MKGFLKRLPMYLLIVGAIVYGAWQFLEQNPTLPILTETIPTEADPTQPDEQVLPETVLQVGDTFDYYPWHASGHLQCTVSRIWMVTGEENCPDEVGFHAKILSAKMDGEWENFQGMDTWFTPGGAFDAGCRIIMAELTVTNIDAKGYPYEEGNDGFEAGLVPDPYGFYGPWFLGLADLSQPNFFPDGTVFTRRPDHYFSHRRPYSETMKDDDEEYAIYIPANETVTFTLGFGVAGIDGQTEDLSKLMLCVGSDSYAQSGIFIDLGLSE